MLPAPPVQMMEGTQSAERLLCKAWEAPAPPRALAAWLSTARSSSTSSPKPQLFSFSTTITTPRSSRITLHVIDLLVLFTNNCLYCDQRKIWSRQKFETSGWNFWNLLRNFCMKFPEEILELVEELPELADPKMTCQNDVTTSKLLEVLTSQPQNY